MIEAFSLRNAHEFGDALASQARLRCRVFVEQRKLDHRAYDSMEYDEFDTPAAVYLVWRDEAGAVRGLLRLLPTTLPYMLRSYWPHLVNGRELPCDDAIWEVTRLCVDRSLEPRTRLRIMPELLCGLHELSAGRGIVAVIGVTRQHLIEHFIRQGITWLGEPDIIEGELERAFLVPLAWMRPHHHCRKLGIDRPVLSLTPAPGRRIAA